jgi:hypothetical protein
MGIVDTKKEVLAGKQHDVSKSNDGLKIIQLPESEC